MNNKTPKPSLKESDDLDLSAAVELFVARGGVIDIVSGTHGLSPVSNALSPPLPESSNPEKLELLKSLVAKGAGISALQYSLRMNKKDIKQLATEHGVKIELSRPLNNIRRAHRDEAIDIDDTVAGHAMHYSSLGYTAPEIARVLELSLRQVWDIGKAYRIQFKHKEDDTAP